MSLSQTSQTLRNCTNSLSTSVSLLSSSTEALDTLTSDFTSLQKLLTRRQVFTIVPEYDVINAKENISAEIQPKVGKLMDRIKVKISRLERQRSTLLSKVKRNDERIAGIKKLQSKRSINRQKDPSDRGSSHDSDLERLRELRMEKNRIKMLLSNFALSRTRMNLRGSGGFVNDTNTTNDTF